MTDGCVCLVKVWNRRNRPVSQHPQPLIYLTYLQIILIVKEPARGFGNVLHHSWHEDSTQLLSRLELHHLSFHLWHQELGDVPKQAITLQRVMLKFIPASWFPLDCKQMFGVFGLDIEHMFQGCCYHSHRGAGGIHSTV